MPLPLVVPLLAASAAASLGGGAASLLSNDEAQKRNRAELEKLEGLEDSGGLGLTPVEQRLLDQRLQAPVANAATAARTRGEQLQASAGTTSGADVARLREEQARIQASAATEAALQVAAADEQKERAQKAELEQRLALKQAMRQDDIAAVTGGIAQASGATAQLAGSMPGTFQLSQAFGSRFSADELNQLAKFADENPEEAGRQFGSLLRKIKGSDPASSASSAATVLS